jgi:hypothetical protein|tara:strand:+ start:573 stop:794 length:222 start_codon:yes stop_codon:yes gene_type:complete
MKFRELKPIDQRRVEQNISQVSRIPTIDKAVGRLEVQIEEVNARLDSYEEVLESLRDFFIELSAVLKKETADD